MAFLGISGLNKRFGLARALKDINLSVEQGGILAVTFGIRSEAILCRLAENAADEQGVAVDCDVNVIEPAGAGYDRDLAGGGGKLTAHSPADARLQVGLPAPFLFDMTRALFFDPETTSRIM